MEKVTVLEDGYFKEYKGVYIVFNTNGYTCSEPLFATTDKIRAEKYIEENCCSTFKFMPLYE